MNRILLFYKRQIDNIKPLSAYTNNLKTSAEARTVRICRASEYFSVIPEMVMSPNSSHCITYLAHSGKIKVLSTKILSKKGKMATGI
jgi:hypothetical protein